ncbi:MAG: hypothetical protein K0S29_769 [Gammaproteobacteria bacterium]|jgi:hypothetical protein|nr:hypothetical protein [Gammaproteobacteria bacterium]
MPNKASKSSSLLKLLALAAAGLAAAKGNSGLPEVEGLTNFTISPGDPQPWAPSASVIGKNVSYFQLIAASEGYKLNFTETHWANTPFLAIFDSRLFNLNETLRGSLADVIDPKNPPEKPLDIVATACGFGNVCGPDSEVYGTVNQTALVFNAQHQAQAEPDHALRHG